MRFKFDKKANEKKNSFLNKKSKFSFDRPTIVSPTINMMNEGNIHRRIAIEALKLKKTDKGSRTDTLKFSLEDEDRIKKAMSDMNKKLPTGFLNDLYSMFYNDSEDIKISELSNRSKKVKHKLLTKLYDTNSKLVTENSSLNSSFYTGNILKVLLEHLEKQDQDMSDDEGNGDNLPSDEQLDKMLNDPKFQKKLEKAKKQAGDKSEEVESAMRSMGMEEGDSRLEDLDIMDLINSLSLSSGMVKQILSKILQLYSSKFSHTYDRVDVGIFEADDFDDLEEIEFLHPVFRNAHLDDIVTEERKYKGKLDIYIDSSGSMGSGHNSDLSKAKSIAIKLKMMGFVDNINFFDSRLYYKEERTIRNVMAFNSGGGTTMENPVKHAFENSKNAVIITDGGGHVNTYHPGVIFIGIPGSDFSYTNSNKEEGFPKYIKNDQCYYYDGKAIVNWKTVSR